MIGLPVRGEIRPGADLPSVVLASLAEAGDSCQGGDVLVATQKVVSKAEGRLVCLTDVEPSDFARQYAAQYGKDPRQVEVVLRESRRIVRMDRGIIISETHHGFVCANAGVDASNVDGGSMVSLLPVDPDGSAANLRQQLHGLTGVDLAVIISDTFGRVWREGLTNVAIGVAGMDALQSFAGQRDPFGYELRVTIVAAADELASAGELVMGKTAGVPFALVRGYKYTPGNGTARDLVRDPALDMFR